MVFVSNKNEGYLYLVGGTVQFGESSKECVEREVFEETGLSVDETRLSVVCENFFQEKVSSSQILNWHTVEFFYHLDVSDISNVRTETDCCEPLVWVPIKDLNQYNIKPSVIIEQMNEILTSQEVIHIVHRD